MDIKIPKFYTIRDMAEILGLDLNDPIIKYSFKIELIGEPNRAVTLIVHSRFNSAMNGEMEEDEEKKEVRVVKYKLVKVDES